MLSVTVDLSKISNSTGIASAPVDITISSEYSDSVYEIGDYTIMVKYE